MQRRRRKLNINNNIVNNDFINILIPIYNGIEFLPECIASVQQQKYTNWEVIIGINGHTSNSSVYKTAKQYESDKIHVYDLPVKGKANALNEMVTKCKHSWVAILDVDDKWHADKLLAQSKYMHLYDVIGTFCYYFGDLNMRKTLPVGDLKNCNFLEFNPLINSSVILKKELACWRSKFN